MGVWRSLGFILCFFEISISETISLKGSDRYRSPRTFDFAWASNSVQTTVSWASRRSLSLLCSVAFLSSLWFHRSINCFWPRSTWKKRVNLHLQPIMAVQFHWKTRLSRRELRRVPSRIPNQRNKMRRRVKWPDKNWWILSSFVFANFSTLWTDTLYPVCSKLDCRR